MAVLILLQEPEHLVVRAKDDVLGEPTSPFPDSSTDLAESLSQSLHACFPCGKLVPQITLHFKYTFLMRI